MLGPGEIGDLGGNRSREESGGEWERVGESGSGREEGRGRRNGGIEEDIKSYTSTWQDLVVFWFLGTKPIGNVYIRMTIASTGFHTRFLS